MSTPTVYFTGVAPSRNAGHFCHRDGSYLHEYGDPVTPWGTSGFYPLLDWHPDRDGDRVPRGTARRRYTQDEGEFVHLIRDGWTLLAAWDRSGDIRYGSTATFAIGAEITSPEEALATAREVWPDVFDRIEKHIGRTVTARPWDPA